MCVWRGRGGVCLTFLINSGFVATSGSSLRGEEPGLLIVKGQCLSQCVSLNKSFSSVEKHHTFAFCVPWPSAGFPHMKAKGSALVWTDLPRHRLQPMTVFSKIWLIVHIKFMAQWNSLCSKGVVCFRTVHHLAKGRQGLPMKTTVWSVSHFRSSKVRNKDALIKICNGKHNCLLMLPFISRPQFPNILFKYNVGKKKLFHKNPLIRILHPSQALKSTMSAL